MKGEKIKDEKIKEKDGGEKKEREEMCDKERKKNRKKKKEVQELPTDVLVQERMDKFFTMGVYDE